MFQFLAIAFTFSLLLLPIISAALLARRRRASATSWISSTLIAAGGCYLLLLASVKTTDHHYQRELDRYHLDHDGGFSQEEQSPEMERAMANHTNDTGRSLAPITGLITCPIYAVFWHLLFGVPSLLWRRRQPMTAKA